MPGAVAVRFAREPDYFLGTTIMGDPCDVLIARARPDGRLAGIACRAERPRLRERAGGALGYIGQIRVAPSSAGAGSCSGARSVLRGMQARRGLLYFGVIAAREPARPRSCSWARGRPAGCAPCACAG